MGGKSKQAQRTKNNVRPSSSGRSAEQLCGVVGGGGGVGGAGTALFPSLAAAAPDPALPTDFALCFKKLNKKDPVTKAKALQELTELVQNSKADDVVAALPTWTHSYRSLALDTDRKVRELTQACHGAICAASGRRLAPHLRALLPVWLTAQYDDHAPAMTRAQRSLHSTFPGNKLPDAISFCKEEILTHIIDNLLDADAAIGKKACGEEERAAAAELAAAASLQGLRCVVARLPAAAADWLWARLQPLLGAPAFWRLAARPPAVRAAWYGALAALAARFGARWAAAAGARSLRLLLAAREPPAAPAAAAMHWDALLHVLRADPDWYERLEKKDALTKKIVETLEGGGWGDARRLAETLLPLLALLPPDLLTADFYAAFFDACLVGLEKKNVSSSKSERAAWIASVAECVRYVSRQEGAAAAAACVAAHRGWARAALRARPPAAARLSAAHMAALLRYWLRLATATTTAPRYDGLVRAAWQNLAAVMLAQLDDLDAADAFDAEAFASALETHALFLRTLKTSYAQAPKERQTIKFEDETKSGDDSPNEATTADDSEPPSETSEGKAARDAGEETATSPAGAAGAEEGDEGEEAGAAARYLHNLAECVQRVSCRAVQLAAARRAAHAAARGLPPLLDEFGSRALLTALGGALGDARPAALYDRALRPWLADDDTRAPPVLDLAFLLMRHLTEQERDVIYDTFEQAGEEVCSWAVCRSARHPARQWAAARRWLQGAAARAALLRGVRAAGGAGAALAELTAPLLAAPAAAALLRALAAALLTPAAAAAATAAARLATRLAAPHPPDGYDDLLLALFRLTLHRQSDEEISSETACEVRGAWQDGLLALAPPLRDRVVDEMLASRDRYLNESDSEELELSRVEHATSVCAYMVSADGSEEDVAALLARVLPAPDAARRPVLPHALRHDAVVGRLVCPTGGQGVPGDVGAALRRVAGEGGEGGDPAAAELRRGELRPLCRQAVARAVLLRAVTRSHAARAALLDHAPLRLHVLHLLHDYALLCSLKDGYAFWPHYADIEVTERQVGALLTDMSSEWAADTARGVLAAVTSLAAADGHYWAYARAVCLQLTAATTATTTATTDADVTRLEDTLTGDGFFHTVQAEAALATASEEERVRAQHLCAVRALLAVWPPAAPAPAWYNTPADLVGAGPCAALDTIVDAHYLHPENMLYDTELPSAAWSRATWAAAALRAAARALAAGGWLAADRHWDFAAISLASLLHALRLSRRAWGCAQVAMVACAAVELLEVAVQFVADVPAESQRRQPAPHVAALPHEWRDVCAPDVAAHVHHLLLHVLETDAESAEMTACQARVVSCLCRAVRAVRWEHMSSAARAELPLARAARAAARVLAAPAHHAYKYLAYCTLLALADPLVLDDAEKLRAWAPAEAGDEGDGEGGEGEDEDEEGAADAARPQFLLQHFHEPLLTLLDRADAAPPDAGEEAALGLLLLWDALCACLARARSELAAQYRAGARACRLAQRLLPAALRLLPAPLQQYATHARDAPPPPLQRMFLAAPPRRLYEPAGAGTVQWLACRALFTGVSGVWAACARAWRGAAEARAGRALSRLVAAYVTPELVERQLRAVLARAAELPDADVGAHVAAREAWCVVRVEERGVELRVWLARDHPLSLPRVEAPAARHSPAPATHWLAVFLAYQDGSVLDALKMWARAVTARVEAAPQCYICYCRLHPSSGRLPAVPCRQCRNKFHNLCLRKWFASSNKSNCPLCRANF